MVKKEKLLQIFNKNTSGKNYVKGQKVFENDLVSSVDVEEKDSLIIIDGVVLSENLFNEYNTNIEIDSNNKSILSTYCTCEDFEKKEFTSNNYCCKHLVGTFYKSLNDLEKYIKLEDEDKAYDNSIMKEEVFKKDENILDLLIEDNKKEEIKIEIYINKCPWNDELLVELKIGLKSIDSKNLYVLKDIDQFLTSYYNNMPIKYGKNFILTMAKEKFTAKDRRLIKYIELLKSMDDSVSSFYKKKDKSDKNIQGKLIKIPNNLTRYFFDIIKDHKFYLNEGFFYRPVQGQILFKAPDINFKLKTLKDQYILNCTSQMPETLGGDGDVFLFGTNIYLPDYEFCYKISPYMKIFNQSKSVAISNKNENKVLNELIPRVNSICNELTLSKSIQNKVVIADVSFNFYFNMKNNKISLTVKVKYDKYEFNIFDEFEEKIIYRDKKKEEQIIKAVYNLGFEDIDKDFYFIYGDDYIFNFFKNDIERLQNLGEVYYSENFKGIKSLSSKSFNGHIKVSKNNYFEMDFQIKDVSKEELSKILRSFRDNVKYYKLKNGEYLDLENIHLKNFLKMLDIVDFNSYTENYTKVCKSKAMFLEDYLKKNNIKYIKGKENLKEIIDKFKNIEKLEFEEPKDLCCTLRSYQKIGYNWFKTLQYLGFGGVLADEMGLGKTLQTIAFILSNKNSKSLIIVPTSLIYNWKNEFEKFAPNLNVAVNNGTIEEREDLIKNIHKFDVVITTYNLLKRDIENYKNIEFDCIILDEAQNIKNNNCQNSKAVKELRGKNKFALTGTPIENSLMELWSIFDFIMPNYLYDDKKFNYKYNKNKSKEALEELNNLIKPFILRRYKKDVIKELPDKIENTLIVSLTEEQKKIYKTYADYAVQLIEKKVKDDEFKNSKIEILSYITKLRQLALDPAIVINDYNGGSGKIDILMDLIIQNIESGHKILLFSQFTSVLKNIGDLLKNNNIDFSYLDGSVSSEKRMKMVDAFNKGENNIFLISLKAGGTGLNLTSADVVIHFDPWWNPAVEDQATDRAHRIGQKNVVEVIKIIAKGTIEEKIIALQEEKRQLISNLIGDDFSSNNNLSSLTEEDILSLFEIK